MSALWIVFTGRAVSKAGKELLIKSVAQAIPTYATGVFLLPESLCKEIEGVFSRYWWKQGVTTRGIHWFRWPFLCRAKDFGGMVFRSMHLFNLALVAKQGWRLLRHPECLMARILKARYYHNSSFFSSSLGGNPSLVWSSIWKAKHVIQQGARICIGNGRTTSVWNDPWITGAASGRLSSRPVLAHPTMTMSELMCDDGGGWNVGFLQSLFTEEECRQIQSIPLSVYSREDQWTWLNERNGIYSVRSAYRLLTMTTSFDDPFIVDQFWRKLWQVEAPPKMTHLIWRAVTGCLPTRFQLVRRKVSCPALCPICHGAEETVMHCLLQCQTSKQIWINSGLGIHNAEAPSFKDWLLTIFETQQRYNWGKFYAVCWGIWKARNTWVWNQTSTPTHVVISSSLSYLGEWICARQADGVIPPTPIRGSGRNRWEKPTPGSLKLNVDAATFVDSGAVSGVCRDQNGRFLGAYVKPIPNIMSSDVLEALAIREALSWIKDRHRGRMIVETDCQQAVLAIHGNMVAVSGFHMIIQDCVELLTTLCNVRVSFVHRSANCVAHDLARAAQLFSDLQIWDVTPPICITASLDADLVD